MRQTLTEVLFADDTTLFCLNKDAEFFKEKYQESIDLFGQTENVKKEERLVIRHRAENRNYQTRAAANEEVDLEKPHTRLLGSYPEDCGKRSGVSEDCQTRISKATFGW